MTTKEMDIKLARDIARLRMLVALHKESTNLSQETLKAMKDLNAGHEQDILTELSTINAITMMQPQLLTGSYIKQVETKLNLRKKARLAASPLYKAFTSADYKWAAALVGTITSAAAQQVNNAIYSGRREVILSSSLVEAYTFDPKQAFVALLQQGKLSKELITNIEFAAFPKGVTPHSETIEYMEKVQYYGTWIYEKFQPLGVVKVEINRNGKQCKHMG